ncbi:hypothetical protein V2J09_021117 [Rumex salicifolius]
MKFYEEVEKERREEVRQEAVNNTITEDNEDNDQDPRVVTSGRVSTTLNGSKISSPPPTKKRKSQRMQMELERL